MTCTCQDKGAPWYAYLLVMLVFFVLPALGSWLYYVK